MTNSKEELMNKLSSLGDQLGEMGIEYYFAVIDTSADDHVVFNHYVDASLQSMATALAGFLLHQSGISDEEQLEDFKQLATYFQTLYEQHAEVLENFRETNKGE